MLIIITFIILVGLFLLITNIPSFGRLPKGLRKEQIMLLSNYQDGALQNLSPTPMQPEGISLFTVFRKYLFEKHPDTVPVKPIRIVQPDLNGAAKSEAPEIIWFGHSSYLIKINGYRVLVDPVFSPVPSPFSFIGSKVFPGTNFVNAEDFKNIDVLLITHDHYDHLDYKSILKIAPNTKRIITSIGVGSHFEYWGIEPEKIHELHWNESIHVTEQLQFTAVPARHFTGRKFKRNQTLWSAFVLKSNHHKLFLGGDSGYDTHFTTIGETYGPFDLAILECGQYNAYWPYIHMFPEDTVQAAIDLNAKILMPVHWGKFSLAMHPWNEPADRVAVAAAKANFPVMLPKLGATSQLDHYLPIEKWWLE